MSSFLQPILLVGSPHLSNVASVSVAQVKQAMLPSCSMANSHPSAMPWGFFFFNLKTP